jgi:hypothetical protein
MLSLWVFHQFYANQLNLSYTTCTFFFFFFSVLLLSHETAIRLDVNLLLSLYGCMHCKGRAGENPI